MDSYVEQNDHLYKACGFRIDGAYYINGEEGDPNELSKKFGKSNKKGNKYGLSKIGSSIYSYADYEKKADGAKESQDIISIGVIIDYEPVEAYKISGHIEEELELEIEPSKEMFNLWQEKELTITINSKGQIKLKVDYDFQGIIQLVDRTATGTIKFANAEASLSTGKMSYRGAEGGFHICDVTLDLFTTINIKKTDSPTYNINATLSDSKSNITINDIRDNIVSINGKSHVKETASAFIKQNIGDWDIEDSANSEMNIKISSDKPLLNFELTEGTKTYTSTKFKDNYSLVLYDDGDPRPEEEKFNLTSKKTSTKQTITIEYMTEE